ncbi:MAG TPA: ABC transporter ATP-binding protein [Gemmatimonadaceae bacterium]|nr:ABC transporter ATP-binding protein [Gemmatimonadaceae bacterium]
MKQLKRLLPYFRPYVRQLAAGLALVIISTAISSVIPWLLSRGIDSMRRGASLKVIWAVGAAIVGSALFTGVMRYGMRTLMNGISRRIEYDVRSVLFRHLELLDAKFFSQMRTGDIMARLTNDLSAVRMTAGPAIMYLVNTIASGVFALLFMLRIDVWLTVLALLPMLLLPIMTMRLGKAINMRFDAVQEHFSTLTTHAQENLTGARIVRAYRQEAAEVERFQRLSDEYLDRNMALVKLYATMNPSFSLLAGLGSVVVIALGGSLVIKGTISVGAFVAFGLYLGLLTWPLIALGWVVNLFQRGGASMARIATILDAEPSITAPAESVHSLPAAAKGRTIEFRDVGFHYPPPEGSEPRWILRNVNFVVPAGSTLGVVGATGSGKTALMDLIPRFYDPQEGNILIDGVSIRELSLTDLRREIGFVQQESVLFSDTIAANIGYASANTSDIEWAARTAQLDTTIAEFPGGYETMLGERGINLSGGQKQRASLARALARKPSIVLLDDALSAVDTHTEAEILRELGSALTGRTAVIASHRASSLRHAEQIIVLENGHVIEEGTHESLMHAEGRYWSLLRRQQLVEEIESDDVPAISGANGL